MTLIEIFKRMKNEKTFYGKINKTDMISYNRSGGYHAITVHYDIGTNKRKIEGYDSHIWADIENFLRKRFDYNCQRKEVA